MLEIHITLEQTSHVLLFISWSTCAFPYDGIKFRAEEGLRVVEDELHHHWLDAHLHERRCAAKTGRLDLSGPETQLQYITTYFTALDYRDVPQFTVTETPDGNRVFVANGATLTVSMEPHMKSDSLRVTWGG